MFNQLATFFFFLGGGGDLVKFFQMNWPANAVIIQAKPNVIC